MSATIRSADIRPSIMDKRYEKIIGLEHHTSATRKPMTLYSRAAQFSPFAALTGYEDIISDTAERQIKSFD